MIFAAAPSQSEMLSALRDEKDIDWSRITAFHMDEYLDLPRVLPNALAVGFARPSSTTFPLLPYICSSPAIIPRRRLQSMPPSSRLRRLILSVVASAPMAISRLTIHLLTSTIR